MILRFLSVFLLFLVLSLSSTAHAFRNVDVVTFAPANDGGRFVTLHQSSTLQQGRFSGGLFLNYSYQPLELTDEGNDRLRGIVDDLVMADIGAAVGITDWWQIGANFPIALWETFYDPNARLSVIPPKETFWGTLADIRVDMKLRLMDIDRHRVGIALVPFFYFPTGKEERYMGNGMYSPGGALVVDFDIKNRVFFTINGGYRNYRFTHYHTWNSQALLDDTIFLGVGTNIRVSDSFALIAEGWHEGMWKGYMNFVEKEIQNPSEFLVAGRYSPQNNLRGMAFTFGAGRALTIGPGSPDFRIFAGINYRKPAVVSIPPPVEVEAIVEEKIVITQKIHFEFDRAVVRDVSRPILDDVASLLLANSQIQKIRIEGHTDWIGTDVYNQKLSEARARAVRDYLADKGVPAARLEFVGYGETRPIADNETVKGRARNRRTEFTVVEVSQ
ncbi:MAG: OmpA family protein [Deltaproteobacteria bacterium]|nr:OmpA family protein [Deltaproteobacteria bacterium]